MMTIVLCNFRATQYDPPWVVNVRTAEVVNVGSTKGEAGSWLVLVKTPQAQWYGYLIFLVKRDLGPRSSGRSNNSTLES